MCMLGVCVGGGFMHASFIADCLLRQFAYSEPTEVLLRIGNLCKELIKMSHGRCGATLNRMWEWSGSNSQPRCLGVKSFRLLSAFILFFFCNFYFYSASLYEMNRGIDLLTKSAEKRDFSPANLCASRSGNIKQKQPSIAGTEETFP